MKNAFFYETPIGKIGIAENGLAITNVFFNNTVKPEKYDICETILLKDAGKQLNEYFCGKRKSFELSLELEGTDFQKIVWNELLGIPYGKTVTYAQIAGKIGKPTAYRAVGMANGLNPISIFIPCHRVIGTNGNLTGYAGGLPAKQFLLSLEGII